MPSGEVVVTARVRASQPVTVVSVCTSTPARSARAAPPLRVRRAVHQPVELAQPVAGVLGVARNATGLGLAFDHGNPRDAAGAGRGHRGREPRGAAADHQNVELRPVDVGPVDVRLRGHGVLPARTVSSERPVAVAKRSATSAEQ